MDYKKFIQQPLEGLLYDLDLLPEQCLKQIDRDRFNVIKELKAENKKLREALKE